MTSGVEIQIVGQHIVIEALKDHNHAPIVHDLSTKPITLSNIMALR